MTDLKGQLGIQTWCFRHFKQNQEVIDQSKSCKVSAVELAGVHADFSNEALFDKVIRQYQEAGIQILSIGVQRLANDAGKEESYYRFVKQAQAKYMSVTFDEDCVPDGFRLAEKLADKYDLYLAIHNHGRHDWLGSMRMLKKVFQQTTPRIGLCLDTAWALDAGEDPIAMVECFGDRLYGLHFKDFVFNRAGKPEDVIIGTGILDLVKLHAALKKADFRGFAVVEYEGDVENPLPALQRCVKSIRKEFDNE